MQLPALGWRFWLTAIVFAVDVVTSLHALLRKRDVRAAIGWVGLIWLVPGVGALLYALLGVNRIQRRALGMHRTRRRIVSQTAEYAVVATTVGHTHASLTGLARLAEQISGRVLLGGNRIEPLVNGDETYPAYVTAIEEARKSVALSSYIFGVDAAGAPIIQVLAAAVRRGVTVRVLIDGLGSLYTWPRAHRALRQAGVPVALFQPTIAQAGLGFFNLRSHRKMLVVDGTVAFTGGMNIHADNILASSPKRPVQDVQFRVRGPVVRQLLDAFVSDWAFVTGEVLDGHDWYPPIAPAGDTVARVITDGPDGDIEVSHTLLLGALASARKSARIVTPYFLPDSAMIAALKVAALRGVAVDIVLPARGNIPPAQWAAAAQLWQVLEPGCRVHLTPPPFDHAKMFVVDGEWALIGSTNWDPRSLRLNFELDIECHDKAFAASIDALVDERIARGKLHALADADGRLLPIKIRDGIARLFSPYL